MGAKRRWRALLYSLATSLHAVAPLAAAETRNAAERLRPERLAAAHADVGRLRAQRRELPPLPDLHDFRAIFHAHAGDSEHTGGSLDEILADAQRVGVQIVFLGSHHRPPRDFMATWRGLRGGVLFVPGAEARGLLLHPEGSVQEHMERPIAELIAAVERGAGMAFLSHVEEREGFPLDGLTGMEIYNRHADVFDDRDSMRLLGAWMTDPDGLERLRRALELYPAEVLASQVHRPDLYLARWDRETQKRRVVGIAANDCHHNQVFVVKKIDDDSVRLGTVIDEDEEMQVLTSERRPRLREITAGHRPGDEIARFDFDPYYLAMHNVSTHVLASALSEDAVRSAVAAGRLYVSHDWMADPTGFRFGARLGDQAVAMGGEAELNNRKESTGDALAEDRAARADGVSDEGGAVLEAELPLVAEVRLLHDGQEVLRRTTDHLRQPVGSSGVYRLEAFLEIDGELRPWIYSNPIYLQDKSR